MLLLKQASAKNFFYDIYEVDRQTGNFKVHKNIKSQHTKMRILDHLICEVGGKTLDIEQTQKVLYELNYMRKKKKLKGHFIIVKDVSKAQTVYRVLFKNEE